MSVYVCVCRRLTVAASGKVAERHSTCGTVRARSLAGGRSLLWAALCRRPRGAGCRFPRPRALRMLEVPSQAPCAPRCYVYTLCVGSSLLSTFQSLLNSVPVLRLSLPASGTHVLSQAVTFPQAQPVQFESLRHVLGLNSSCHPSLESVRV